MKRIDIILTNRIRLLPIISRTKGFKIKWLFLEIETNI